MKHFKKLFQQFLNFIKRVFFGKASEIKEEIKSADLAPRPSIQHCRIVHMHNNRRTNACRRVQYIHQRDGTIRAIYHQS